VRLKREYITAIFYLTISACASAPSYPDLYKSDPLLSNAETVTELSKQEVLNSLLEGRSNWEKKEPGHYKYIVSASAYFVWHISYGPNEVEVKDGQVVKVTYRGKSRPKFPNGYVLPKDDWKNFSIESYFSRSEIFLTGNKDLIGDDWEDERFWFIIDYESDFGYPKMIARNDPYDYHGEHVFRIGYFEVIQ